MEQLAQELSRHGEQPAEYPSRSHNTFVDVLWRFDWTSWISQYGEDFLNLSQVSDRPMFGKIPITMVILDSLYDENLYARQAAVSEANASTYEWIFNDDSVDERGEPLHWPSFPEWLHDRDNLLYWITGKIGSGKSTLMKHILRDRSLLQGHLSDYAGGLPLTLAAFFIWNPGEPLQKSFEGLIRSLLHQILTDRQELIPLVMPKRWAIYNLFKNEADFAVPEWTKDELVECFDLLCARHGKDLRLMVFLDGLDEFEEADAKPSPIVKWVKALVDKHKVKICVSSRPWNLFSDAFQKYKHFAMQDLTRRDITQYVQAKFEENAVFQDFQPLYEAETAELLVEIVNKANGVFLWVNLVVDALLSYLDDGATVSNLQEKLNEIPDDLKKLYTALWKSLPPERQAGASKILQLCHRQYHSNVKDFWLAYASDNCPVNDLVRRIRGDAVRRLLDRILRGHTRGICELQNVHVRFHHRSAADWLGEASTWSEITKKSPAGFEPSIALWVVRIVQSYMDSPGSPEVLFACAVTHMSAIQASAPSPPLLAKTAVLLDLTNAVGFAMRLKLSEAHRYRAATSQLTVLFAP
jgi:hypothetical protein